MISIGIVGLPNVGKSTLFNALTQKQVPAENFPFCTIDPSVGTVPVPDARLDSLRVLSHSEKTIPAIVEFVDIAGLVRGASEGEGLGNKFLANIREVNAIAEVVRIFDDENIIHVHGGVNPLQDIEVINLELILADMQTLAKRTEGLERDIKRQEKTAVFEKEVLERAMRVLEEGMLLSQKQKKAELFAPEEWRVLTLLSLLSTKPIFYILNKKAGGFNFDEQSDERWHSLLAFFEEQGAEYVCVDASVEGELRELSPEDAIVFRREYGVLDDGMNDLIRTGYDTLGLITYFTTGEKETRAWTVRKGSTAPEAGTAIHNDFKNKFIRAEVVAYEDIAREGGYAKAKEKGLVRTEGKEYIVQDGDILEFKI